MGDSNPVEWGKTPGSSRGSVTETEPCELKKSNPLVCRSPRSSTRKT